jgi:hypothetical protein
MNTMSWDMRYQDAEKIDGLIMWNTWLARSNGCSRKI